jgi:C4-dicarboxylate transporter/malic acid transport protein
MAHPDFSTLSRTLAPGWFAAVMGSGVLALSTHALAQRWPWLDLPAQALHWGNNLLFLLFAIPWLWRWLRFRAEAMQTLRHPVQGNFYPTFSIALLILAAQWRVFTPCVEVALTLWWLGALLHLGFSLAVPYQMFRGEQVTVDHVTPANFIPAVGLVVIPLAGAPLLPEMGELARDWAWLVNGVGFGAGSLMYLGLLGLTLFRKYLHKPAQGILTPTVWIHLAPIGVIPVSLLNVAEQLPFPALRELAIGVMLLLWGFGVWWLVMASLLTLSARAAGQLPFALSWWGFTFPIGAFVAESLRLSKVLGWSSTFAIGVAAWLLLCFFWLVTLFRTARGVASGAIFQPHP